MSGFDADWLALRAPADEAARDAAGLTPALIAALPGREGAPLRVLDLGAGGGNNLHYLAPRLERPQRWTLIDSDRALLTEARRAVPQDSTVATRELDLAGGVEELPLDDCDLVTASALFDLVSLEWIEAFAGACTAAAVPVGLFALTFDGRLGWQPEDAADADVASLFQQHMGHDKGFGPALGPKAPDALAAAFERAGYDVETADSAWRLDADDGALQEALLDGYAAAASEMAPARAAEIEDWAARRRAFVAQARSDHRVGHRDLLVTRPTAGS